MKNAMKLETHLVIAGRDKHYTRGAVSPVIQRASSLVFDTVKDEKFTTANRANGELFYGRRGTYIHFAFQKAISELEGGVGCALYPCNAAAVTNAILAFVQSGDHILMTGAAYEPTQGFYNKILSKPNVETTYYDPLIGAGIADLLRPETKIVFFESPSSTTMEIQDAPGMVKAIRAANLETVIMIDDTWTAGVLFKVLDYGVDISTQAGTKYTIGHSNAMLSMAMLNVRCWDRLCENSYLMGQTLGADMTYNGSRGLCTLVIRFKQHQESSIYIAHWLSAKPEAARVNHSALPECPGHEYFQRDSIGSSGLFSFVLKKRLTDEQMVNFFDNFSLFRMAYSWGGFESLTLTNQPKELNNIRPVGEIDFSGMLVKAHIGLEDVDDLIADLEAGLVRIA